MKRDAFISDCGLFRYWLTRVWDEALPLLCVVMLNPSTADHQVDDATIRKLIGFCQRLGFGGFIVVNLFAFRATKPADMFAATDPVGPLNDSAIIDAVARCQTVLCAWGANAAGHPRERDVLSLFQLVGVELHALRVNADGTPAHPLMLPYSCDLQRFHPER